MSLKTVFYYVTQDSIETEKTILSTAFITQ